jgi:hypothetical protein
MSQRQISLSPDLKRLRDEGYSIEIRANYLLVKDVPYVNSRREVQRGILVSKLNLAGDVTARPDDHLAQFVGEHPCHRDGSPMHELVNQTINTKLDDRLTTNFSFSQKPGRGYYENYHEKMTTYANILSGHAQAIDAGATARIYRVEEPEEEEDSPFNYRDTASSRAEINTCFREHGTADLGRDRSGGGEIALKPPFDAFGERQQEFPTACVFSIVGEVP